MKIRLPLRSRWLGVVAAAFACTLLAVNPDVRDLVGCSVSHLSWKALAATVSIQAAALLLCGAALRCVGPDLRLRDCLFARWLRDAGGNLLIILPGLGELAGVRLLALLGVSPSAAVGAMALDTFAESATQAPYAALALALSPRLRSGLGRSLTLPPTVVLAVAAVCVIAVTIVAAVLRSRTAFLSDLRRFLREVGRKVRGGGRGLLASGALHLSAWVCGGLQVWAAAALLRLSLPLPDALALESLVYVGRGVAFFAPAGLGVQEAGFILGGAMFGLTAPAALSLSLTLRSRDLVVGAPALAAWVIAEMRRRPIAARAFPSDPAACSRPAA